jgi:hypothetical protein
MRKPSAMDMVDIHNREKAEKCKWEILKMPKIDLAQQKFILEP